MRRLITSASAVAMVLILVAASAQPPNRETSTADETSQTATTRASQPALRPETTVESPTPLEQTQNQTANAQAPNYNLDWWSINGGGAISASSANYQMGLSVGQAAAGEATSASYAMGIGFWYGVASGGSACPIVMTGDVNVNGSITSADIIYLVGYVFKGGPGPMPCDASGDANCSGSVTAADIIYLVGYVFKGGPAPCDVCTLIPGTWSCP